MRPPPAQLAASSCEEQDALYRALSQRASVDIGETSAAERTAGAGLVGPQAAIDGTEPGWVVLSQRCDLLRPYCIEPLVELARAEIVERERAEQARLNSPRLMWLCEHDDDGAWVVDLRRLALLPKYLLPLQSPIVQPLTDDRARKAFRYRIAHRYERDPVPEDVVEHIERPLKRVLAKSRSSIKLAGHFTAFIARPDGQQIRLLAIVEDGKPLADAEDAFEQIVEQMKRSHPPAARKLAEESTPLYARDLSYDEWLLSCKLNLDEVSFSRRADAEHAQPY